jgi:hypothetical protein
MTHENLPDKERSSLTLKDFSSQEMVLYKADPHVFPETQGWNHKESDKGLSWGDVYYIKPDECWCIYHSNSKLIQLMNFRELQENRRLFIVSLPDNYLGFYIKGKLMMQPRSKLNEFKDQVASCSALENKNKPQTALRTGDVDFWFNSEATMQGNNTYQWYVYKPPEKLSHEPLYHSPEDFNAYEPFWWQDHPKHLQETLLSLQKDWENEQNA